MNTNTMVALPAQDNASLALFQKSAGRARIAYEQPDERKQLRNIDAFSVAYRTKLHKGVFLAVALVLFSFLCVGLFIMNVDVAALFSIVSLLLLLQLIHCGIDIAQEGVRVQQAYRNYLRGFSRHVLIHLRASATLSAWSKYEIDQYLAMKNRAVS